MTLTNKDLKLIIPFILFVIMGICGLHSVNYISESQTMEATFNWCIIPTIVFALYYAYRSSFGYKEVIVPIWKNILSFTVMTIIIGMVTFISLQGILISINNNIGQQKEYLLSGKIIKLDYPEEKKIGNKYAIEIERKVEKDTIKLNVPHNNYQKGQNFEKSMKIGLLKFIYSEN